MINRICNVQSFGAIQFALFLVLGLATVNGVFAETASASNKQPAPVYERVDTSLADASIYDDATLSVKKKQPAGNAKNKNAKIRQPVKRVPDAMIDPGEPNGQLIIVVEKENQRTFVYEYRDGKYFLDRAMVCSTGEKSGDKMVEGDKKTPEGVYVFVEKSVESELAPIYGVLAYPMDYPNYWDKQIGKGGDGIWMHGINKSLKPMDSNGCIELRNIDIIDLEPHLKLHETAIIVYERLRYKTTEEINRESRKIKSFLDSWRKAWINKDIAGYEAKYAKDFSNNDNRTYDDWMDHKRRLAEKYHKISVELKNVRIFRHGDIIMVLFNQYYQGDSFRSDGAKRLYLREVGGDYKIVAEVWRDFPVIDGPRKMLSAAAKRKVLAREGAAEARVASRITALRATSQINADGKSTVLTAEAERKAEAERRARAEAKRKAESKKKALAEAKRKAEEERKSLETARKAEAERKAREDAARVAETKRKAREEAERKSEEERKAREAVRIAEAKRKAREEAARIAEEKRKVREEELRLAEAKRKADEERKSLEAARIAEAKRKADEERKSLEAARKAEEKRKAEEEALRVAEAKRVAEEKRKTREAAEKAAREQALAEADLTAVKPIKVASAQPVPVNVPGRTAPVNPELDNIGRLVEEWLDAWRDMNLDLYLSFYHSEFRYKDMDLAAYRSHKTSLSKKYKKITIRIKDVKIRVEGDRGRVTFLQDYRSDQYHDYGMKTIVFYRENSDWKIKEEIWRKVD